jgi:hypothetical protein
VFEAGVEVRFSREQHNVLEVCVVDVSVNSEQSFEDYLDDVHEIARKWDANLAREYFFIVEL